MNDTANTTTDTDWEPTTLLDYAIVLCVAPKNIIMEDNAAMLFVALVAEYPDFGKQELTPAIKSVVQELAQNLATRTAIAEMQSTQVKSKPS